MQSTESLIGWVEKTAKNPDNKLAEVGKTHKFEISWDRLVLSEKIVIFLAPTEPLAPEADVLQEWLDRLNPPEEFRNRPFHAGASTYYGKRCYNDLYLSILNSTERIPGTVKVAWTLKVDLLDQEAMTRYAANPVRVEPTELTAERSTIAYLYPNMNFAQKIAAYRIAISRTLGQYYDPLFEGITHTIPADWVRRLDEGNI